MTVLRSASRLVGAILIMACSAGSRPRDTPVLATPAEKLPSLVSTEQLAEWQQTRQVSLIDVRSDVYTYLKGHLPGATFLHVETLRATKGGIPTQLLSSRTYRELFSRLGLRFDTPAVIYSAGETGNMDATFLAWLLDGFGHPEVYVLNGGYFKWELEQRPVVQEYPRIAPSAFPSVPFIPERALLEDVRRAVETGDAILVDARPPEQYSGMAGAQRRRGHIPGAISHYWRDDLTQVGFGHVWKTPAALRAGYRAQGITPDKNIIAYCNSATEASHVHFTLRYLLGYPRVRIYVGSWNEWAERLDLPVVGGEVGKRGSGEEKGGEAGRDRVSP